MMKTVVEKLGSAGIQWSGLVKSECVGIRVIIDSIEGLPAFVGNILQHYLSKEETHTEIHVDENSNVEKSRDFEVTSVDVDVHVEKVLDSIGIEVTGDLSTVQKLELIVKNNEVVKAVKILEPLVKDLKKMTLIEDGNDGETSKVHEDVKEVMRECRTISEVLNSCPEFEKDKEGSISCMVCKTKFRAEEDCNDDEENQILSRKFRNLKITLVKHLESNVHIAECTKKVAVEALEAKQESRVNLIGLVLGSICYLLLKRGRPYEDYTDWISLLAKFGVDVGEINHSHNFVGKFRKRAAEAVQRRWRKHLSTRCPQTGCLPPVKILGDMATHQHWTRQAVGLAVLMPGSKQLIQTIILGFPRICKHNGESLSKNIAETVDPYIKGEQYLGTSFDGAYGTVKVGEKLDEHFGVEGVHDWDPVHAAATICTAMRSDNEARISVWLNKITQTISSCNKFINWGAEWDRFFKVK